MADATCFTCHGAGVLCESRLHRFARRTFRCPGCFGSGSSGAAPSALLAVLNSRNKASSDKRVRRFHEELWEVASRVEWDADDWKDFYNGLTEVFARIADRHATKAGHRPLRTHRARNHEHEDAVSDAHT